MGPFPPSQRLDFNDLTPWVRSFFVCSDTTPAGNDTPVIDNLLNDDKDDILFVTSLFATTVFTVITEDIQDGYGMFYTTMRALRRAVDHKKKTQNEPHLEKDDRMAIMWIKCDLAKMPECMRPSDTEFKVYVEVSDVPQKQAVLTFPRDIAAFFGCDLSNSLMRTVGCLSRSIHIQDQNVIREFVCSRRGVCVSCNATGARKKCASCNRARYCDGTCQKKDWRRHKTVCSQEGFAPP
jgi:hypothetical protein